MTQRTPEPECVASMSAAALMRCAKQGDRESFEWLVARVRPTIEGICSHFLGEDGGGRFQEWADKVWDKRGSYQEEKGNVQGWLCKIAVNHCIDHARRHGKAINILSLSQSWRGEEGTEVTLDLLVDEDENDLAIITLWNDWYGSLSPEEKIQADLYRERGDSRAEVIQKMETYRDVCECLKGVNERAKQVIKGRYEEGKLLWQVATEIGGTSTSRVWQIEQQALEQLRECMRGKGHHIDS